MYPWGIESDAAGRFFFAIAESVNELNQSCHGIRPSKTLCNQHTEFYHFVAWNGPRRGCTAPRLNRWYGNRLCFFASLRGRRYVSRLNTTLPRLSINQWVFVCQKRILWNAAAKRILYSASRRTRRKGFNMIWRGSALKK